jgi:hypothetical protein
MTQLLTGTLAATRKNEMRNLRRFEGASIDDTNITPLSIYSSQSIANSTIREDVEEVNT